MTKLYKKKWNNCLPPCSVEEKAENDNNIPNMYAQREEAAG